MSEEIQDVVLEVEELKPKKRQKKYIVKLVTGSSIVYEDNGVLRYVSKKGFENIEVGDKITI